MRLIKQNVVTLKPLLFLFFLFFCLSSEKGYSSDPVGLTVESYLDVGVSTIYSPNSFYAWGKVKNSSAFSLRGQVWYIRLKHRLFEARMGSEIIISHRFNYPLNGIDGQRDNRTGFGIIPVNMMVPFSSWRIRPFGVFSAGVIALNDKFPSSDGASLNYLLNLGGGFETPFIRDMKLQIGYSIQHMSNANTGVQNPGIDSHMLFLTFLFP